MAEQGKCFEEYKLDNGLVVALKKTPTKTVTGCLRVHKGHFHEREDQKGQAHFLEHCIMDAGTKKYSADQVREIFETIEGKWNATTKQEQTFCNADMLKESVGTFLDITSEMFFTPRFDPSYVERQRQRVLRELEEQLGNPNMPKIMLYRKALYRDHPLTPLYEGHIEGVSNTSIEQLKEFHEQGYGARNMDLLLVGDIPKNVKEVIHQSFNHRVPGQSTRMSCPTLGPLDKKTVIHVNKLGSNNGSQPNASITFSLIAPTETHPDNLAASMLFKLLAGLPNSRLQRRLSRQEGLIYGVTSSYDVTCNAGTNTIEYCVPVKEWDRSVDIMFEEISKIRREGATEKELAKMKRYAKFGTAKVLESNVGQANTIIDFWDTGGTLNDTLKGYEAVTLEDVQRIAQTYLPEDREDGKYVLMIEDPSIK